MGVYKRNAECQRKLGLDNFRVWLWLLMGYMF
jgi:hypothetical protein